MERRFNLIKSDFEKHEKRVLPRFPFCYLTFKADNMDRVFEVKDISQTGMQLSLKDSELAVREDDLLRGSIHWHGQHLDISGVVKWTTDNRLGVEFQKKREVLEKVQSFLDLKEVIKKLRPIHKLKDGLDLPPRLKYWARADGPVEIFVWQHGDGDIAKLQVLLFETFVEWESGQSIKTGRILSKRNVDSPLLTEDEWAFHIDLDCDWDKVQKVKELIQLVPEDVLGIEVRTFLMRQLS